LILIAGIADPYWEGALPLVLILARPFAPRADPALESRATVQAKAVRAGI
jgi:hypothetical protein